MNTHNKISLVVAILALQFVAPGTTYTQGKGRAIGISNVHFTISAPFSIEGSDSADTFTVNGEAGKEFTAVLVSPSYLLDDAGESTNDRITSAAFDPASGQPLFLNGADVYHVKLGDLVSLTQRQTAGHSTREIGLDVQCTVN